MPDFSEILDNVPTWERYYTIDELHGRTLDLVSEHPDKVELLNLGKSTLGENIECLKIGEGRYNALIHGFPNSEEPYGGVVLDHLSRALAENDRIREELDYTWYLVKCSDPDAARRNEGFHMGPLTPLNFSLNYYRTPYSITPDGCFPIRFGPLDLDSPVPETRALMKVLDRVKIHFISALHMMKWGGISHMVPHPCTPLYPELQNNAQRFNIFPRKRPGTMLAPGIMHAEYLTPARNWVRHQAAGNTNIEPIRGCDAYEYAQVLNPDAFIIIPECCIWYEPRMLDDRVSETTLGEAFRYGNQVTNEANNFMLDVWGRARPHMETKTPFRHMVEDFMEPLVKKYTNVSNPPFKFDARVHARKATVAEKIGIEGHDDIYRMFQLGGLQRALDEEFKTTRSPEVEVLRDEAHARLLEYDAFLHENYEILNHPIRNLVGMSTGCLLHSAFYAKTLQR
jgi:hypothetical protein